MLKLFTYVDVTLDMVDFGGQRIFRPDGIGAMQWMDFWEMAKDCRETIAKLRVAEADEDLRDELEDVERELGAVERENERLRGELEAVEDELRTALNEVARREKEIEAMEAELKSAHDEIYLLDAEVQDWRAWND